MKTTLTFYKNTKGVSSAMRICYVLRALRVINPKLCYDIVTDLDARYIAG